jgi:hypothetical protein
MAFILWRLEKMGPWLPGGALPGARWQVDTWRSRYWTVFELTRPVPHSPPPSGIFPGGGAAGGSTQKTKGFQLGVRQPILGALPGSFFVTCLNHDLLISWLVVWNMALMNVHSVGNFTDPN